MMQEQVYINKNIQDVWKFMEEQFCIAYSCSKDELLNKEIELQTFNFMAQPIQVKQRIVEMITNQRIKMETKSIKDIVTTIYELQADEDFTLVSLQEDGKGKESKLRSWNYWMMTFPIFRIGSKKKLKRKLISLRNAIQYEGRDNA